MPIQENPSVEIETLLGGMEGDWLSLSLVPRLGIQKLRALLDRYGDARALLEAGVQELTKSTNMSAAMVQRIVNAREVPAFQMECKLIRQHGVGLTCPASADYPSLLGQIAAPPPVMYYRGNLNAANGFCVGVVGSRVCSPYGRTHTRRLIEELKELVPNLVVVSGLARGIDTIAHSVALELGIPTVAVLAGGLTDIYPPENRTLSENIVQQGGMLITEFPMALKPLARNFPIRNRIISGLSNCVLLTEAGRRSGAKITAAFGLQQNRDVFAMPGNVDSSSSMGCNELIMRGHAKLVISARDILEELNPGTLRYHQTEFNFTVEESPLLDLTQFSGDQAKILQGLAGGTMEVDELHASSGVEIHKLLSGLVELELMGYLQSVPGQGYKLRKSYQFGS